MSRRLGFTRLLSRRPQSTSVRPPPPAELQGWIDGIKARSTTSHEVLTSDTVQRLQSTLPTRLAGTSSYLGLAAATASGALPKAFHLAFFNPQSLLTELGEDGSSTEVNAPSPYLRRMWAGGSFHWSAKPDYALQIGRPTTQLNTVVSAEYKNDMVFVNQQRELYQVSQGDGGAKAGERVAPMVREIRTHVFRREVSSNEAIKAKAKQIASAPTTPSPTHSFTYTPDAPLLFRFSALTYNAHRIHYDRDWCRSVENHPDLVVHGPLTALLLVELAEKVALDAGKQLRSFEYRATSPMYVDKEIQMEATGLEGEGGKLELTARQEGRVGMRAVATFDDGQ